MDYIVYLYLFCFVGTFSIVSVLWFFEEDRFVKVSKRNIYLLNLLFLFLFFSGLSFLLKSFNIFIVVGLVSAISPFFIFLLVFLLKKTIFRSLGRDHLENE